MTSHVTAQAGVPLQANGDFRIDDTLTPAPPSSCPTPVLITNNGATPAATRWFAAGILTNDGDEDD